MSTNTNNVVRSPYGGFLGLLTILFIGLKLTGFIDWSWWLVLLPLYGPLAVIGVMFIIAGLLMAIGAALDKK